MDVHERRQRLIKILTLRGRTPISALARELEVSERTVMRDVDILSLTKPIYTLSGKHGGVCIRAEYAKRPPSLESFETELLQKILRECTKNGSVKLDSSELSVLSDIITQFGGGRAV